MNQNERDIRCINAPFRTTKDGEWVTTCKVYSRWVGPCEDYSFDEIE